MSRRTPPTPSAEASLPYSPSLMHPPSKDHVHHHHLPTASSLNLSLMKVSTESRTPTSSLSPNTPVSPAGSPPSPVSFFPTSSKKKDKRPTLFQIFSSPELLSSFRKFAAESHSERYVLFWVEEEKYRALSDNEERYHNACRLFEVLPALPHFDFYSR
jgi:hypothetical protein